MSNIGILHISDIHASVESQNKITKLCELLKSDIKKLKEEHDTKVELVCITGDLINSGDNSDEELSLVFDCVIKPLMDELSLKEERFFIVPGNHEVKRSKILDYIEKGISMALTSEESINKFINNIESNALERIGYSNDFSSMFGGDPVLKNNLTHSHIIKVGDLNIGVVCVNSAWRSTGAGGSERGKLVIGSKQIIDGLNSIQSADIKICLMHHPFDWLIEDDKTAIEKCINKYDLILNGHIHETNTKKYTAYNGQAIYNTCGKFDKTSDIYNGYSLISVNPFNRQCNIYLRQYFNYPRNCFDAAITLMPDGTFSTTLGVKDNELSLAYNIVHSIKSKFIDYANSFFVENVVAGSNIKSFDESFIVPQFSKYSEYEKETEFSSDDEDEKTTLEEICNCNENILLLGKKEVGKTTLLHYMIKHYNSEFDTIKSLPIFIDCATINYAGKDIVVKAARNFINEYCSDNESFTNENVINLLEKGLCTIFFDNFEMAQNTQLTKINEFLNKYSSNRFIFSEAEYLGAKSLREISVVPDCKYREIHICSLTKGQIRSYAKNYFAGELQDNSSTVEKIMICFNNTMLPKTPFVLSVILSECNSCDFSPINEATVMELFIESLLEKSSPSEVDSGTYDFKNKEDFLMHLVDKMHSMNCYCFTVEKFEEILHDYHANYGFAISNTHFDKLFFEKGILIKNYSGITFRYASLIEYYLAKLAKENTKFLNNILSDKNYLNYGDELIYFTGLNRRDTKVLKVVKSDMVELCNDLKYMLAELSNYDIGLDFNISNDALKESMSKKRFTQEESDEFSDPKRNSTQLLPENINKQKTHNDGEMFVKTLLIYGNCLRNLELISVEEKKEAFDIYVNALCIMLAILKSETEDFFKKRLEKMESNQEEFDKEEIKKEQNIVADILKIALPIALQNIALENVGTAKLQNIFYEKIKSSTSYDFEKFFSVFLVTDLRLPGIKNVIKQYLSETKRKALLKIIFAKILYYYQFRYFSSSLDPFMENILFDINAKLNNTNNFNKTQWVNKIKKQKKNNLPPSNKV